MLSKAIAKLKSEIEKNKENQYIHIVGEFLLDHLNHHPEDAEKILATDKTIAKSLDAMRTAAQKKKVGNCAVLTDQEGFAVVLKYFGSKSEANITVPAAAVNQKIATVSTKKPKAEVDFDISLDDLL